MSDERKQLAADLLDRLQQLTAPDADLEYSILRGKLDIDEVRTISEGLRVAIEALKRGAAVSGQRYQLWLRLIFESGGHIVAMGRATCSYILLDTHNAEQCERFAEELQAYDYWLQAEGPTQSVQALIGCRNGVPMKQKTPEKGTI